jgi:hypothetical protein
LAGLNDAAGPLKGAVLAVSRRTPAFVACTTSVCFVLGGRRP